MKNKPENPLAFPMDFSNDGFRMQEGMTLRDYFAAKAMPVLLQQKSILNVQETAKHSYQVADAMLAERSKSDG